MFGMWRTKTDAIRPPALCLILALTRG